MRVLDLFSGIGGFSLGLERTGGFETVAFCEVDPFCRRVLAKHWPEVPCYDDVRSLGAWRLVADGIAVDVICGGFPCQDISTAGRGAGINGERSGLWAEYARLVGELRPRYVIVENVAALLGRGLDRVLGDLAALGYDAEWHCIPASAVGAPHQRDRIWIVAHADGQPWEARCDERRSAVSVRAHRGAARSGSDPVDVAHAESADDRLRHASQGERQISEPRERRRCADVADALRNGLQGSEPSEPAARRRRPSDTRGAFVANAGGQGLPSSEREVILGPRRWHEGRAASERGWWSAEPDVGRVAHGVSGRVDRLRALGNAVVPQIPELIGRAILASQVTRP